MDSTDSTSDALSTQAFAAAALRAHRRSDGPEAKRLLAELASRPAPEVSSAWLLVAKRAYDALPPEMADEIARDADRLPLPANDSDLVDAAWDQATTFLSRAAQGKPDPHGSLRLVQERNPYLPAQLLRAVTAFAAELPEDAVKTALDSLATNDSKP